MSARRKHDAVDIRSKIYPSILTRFPVKRRAFACTSQTVLFGIELATSLALAGNVRAKAISRDRLNVTPLL